MTLADPVEHDFYRARLTRQTGLEARAAAIGAVVDRDPTVHGHFAVTALAAVNRIFSGNISGFRAHASLPGTLSASKNTSRGREFRRQILEFNHQWPDFPGTG